MLLNTPCCITENRLASAKLSVTLRATLFICLLDRVLLTLRRRLPFPFRETLLRLCAIDYQMVAALVYSFGYLAR